MMPVCRFLSTLVMTLSCRRSPRRPAYPAPTLVRKYTQPTMQGLAYKLHPRSFPLLATFTVVAWVDVARISEALEELL